MLSAVIVVALVIAFEKVSTECDYTSDLEEEFSDTWYNLTCDGDLLIYIHIYIYIYMQLFLDPYHLITREHHGSGITNALFNNTECI